ncbi:MAG: FixH family protein [Acidobacteriota bacterium]|nr:FixH family protein [Acidobacteriota bacterium]
MCHRSLSFSTKTTARRRFAIVLLSLALLSLAGCGSRQKAEAEHEEEALARTEFTDRIENFFEYEPLKAGKPSQFLIHLTDLTDGTPVEKAEVTLSIHSKGGGEVAQVKGRVGKVTGIYVADVSIPRAGEYDIEFHVKNSKLDERLPLRDFKVE